MTDFEVDFCLWCVCIRKRFVQVLTYLHLTLQKNLQIHFCSITAVPAKRKHEKLIFSPRCPPHTHTHTNLHLLFCLIFFSSSCTLIIIHQVSHLACCLCDRLFFFFCFWVRLMCVLVFCCLCLWRMNFPLGINKVYRLISSHLILPPQLWPSCRRTLITLMLDVDERAYR